MSLDILLDSPGEGSIPIRPLRKEDALRWLAQAPPPVRRWVETTRFEFDAGKHRFVPGTDGELGEVLLGLGEPASPWDWASLPGELPLGNYHVAGTLATNDADAAALGFALGTYRFDRLRTSREKELSRLAWPDATDRKRVAASTRATFLVRDLINSPASDMGPAELTRAAEELASDHQGSFRVIVGESLLEENFPAVHAVGRAAAPDRAPRLIDIAWGDPALPKVTLVGKGVCFDSGGLDLKPASYMKLMKKDMGGAAHVLGLASMILEAEIPGSSSSSRSRRREQRFGLGAAAPRRRSDSQRHDD